MSKIPEPFLIEALPTHLFVSGVSTIGPVEYPSAPKPGFSVRWKLSAMYAPLIERHEIARIHDGEDQFLCRILELSLGDEDLVVEAIRLIPYSPN